MVVDRPTWNKPKHSKIISLPHLSQKQANKQFAKPFKLKYRGFMSTRVRKNKQFS